MQVCENDGAKWLVRPLSIVQTHRARGYTAEAVFEIENLDPYISTERRVIRRSRRNVALRLCVWCEAMIASGVKINKRRLVVES